MLQVLQPGPPQAQEIDREIGSTIKPKRNSYRRKARLLGGFHEESIPADRCSSPAGRVGVCTDSRGARQYRPPLKGCLGGSDGNYTIAEDNTGKIFKITTSSADLKPHLGQDVNLIGHKADAA